MYPEYSRSERIADGSMHAIGVIAAISGAIALMIWAADTATVGEITALAIYAATLVATFTASACYHMTPWESIRPTLRRIDHAAIYLKIAGTYTPLVVTVGGWLAYTILGIIWGLAVLGMTLKLFFWQVPGRYGPALYLFMGWLSVVLIWSAWGVIPKNLIMIGGGLYTVGVIFYAAEKMKFSNAIWHGFVIAASACFFAAIAMGMDRLA